MREPDRNTVNVPVHAEDDGTTSTSEKLIRALDSHRNAVWDGNVPAASTVVDEQHQPIPWQGTPSEQLFLKLHRERQIDVISRGSLSEVHMNAEQLATACPNHLQPAALGLASEVRDWAFAGLDMICPPSSGPIIYKILSHAEFQEWSLLGEAFTARLRDLKRLSNQQTRPPRRALSVDLHNNVVVLDGVRFAVTTRQAEIVKKLLEAGGGWVSSSKLKEHEDSEERPDKIVNRIRDKALKEIIECRPGTGIRLKLS